MDMEKDVDAMGVVHTNPAWRRYLGTLSNMCRQGRFLCR